LKNQTDNNHEEMVKCNSIKIATAQFKKNIGNNVTIKTKDLKYIYEDRDITLFGEIINVTYFHVIIKLEDEDNQRRFIRLYDIDSYGF